MAHLGCAATQQERVMHALLSHAFYILPAVLGAVSINKMFPAEVMLSLSVCAAAHLPVHVTPDYLFYSLAWQLGLLTSIVWHQGQLGT